MVLWSHTKIYFKELRKYNFLLYFCSKIYVFALQNDGAMQTLPRKIMVQCRLCPARSQSLRSLPRKIVETLFFAPQNYGAMQTLLCKIMET